jgi:hypothetical protein
MIPSRVVAVEGILVVWKAALFAGRHRNDGLGRSVRSWRFLRHGQRADDSGCPEAAEEGNAVGMRHKAYAPGAGTRDRRMRIGDASFARSFDPCTSILTTLRWGNSRRWGVGVDITGGQTRASEKNHHWGRHRRT